MVDETGKLIAAREKTHGYWRAQATLAQSLKNELGVFYTVALTDAHREALEMICVKMSRIVCGDPNEPDHWDDIAGYAHLGKIGNDSV